MKKMLLILAAIVQSTAVLAYDFFVDGIYYNILSETEKTLAVTNGGLNGGPTDYVGDVLIPSEVNYGGDTWHVTAFDGATFHNHQMLNSIVISEGIKVIPPRTFYGCTDLHSVTLPNSIDSIGDRAFYKNLSLTEITLPARLEHVGTYMFEESGIKHIKIPETMTAIPEGMFFYCEELESVDLPRSIRSIGAEAFHDCKNLRSIIFPDQLERIGICAFNESGLEAADIPNSVTFIDEMAFGTNPALASVHLPETLTELSSGILSGCSGLTSLIIPETVEYIGKYAFQGTSIDTLRIPEAVTYIGEGAFSANAKLCSVNIPQNITDIEAFTFTGCTSLARIILYEGITHIGKYAFSHCTALDSLMIPTSVKYIDESAFNECASLTEIVFPPLLETISPWVCCLCTSLKRVVIPEGVTWVKDYAFGWCDALMDVYSLSKNPPTCYSGFKDVPLERVTLHVYTEYSYRNQPPWSLFGNIVKIENGELAIESVDSDDSDEEPTSYFSLGGIYSRTPHKGINIIRKGNSEVRKVLIP